MDARQGAACGRQRVAAMLPLLPTPAMQRGRWRLLLPTLPPPARCLRASAPSLPLPLLLQGSWKCLEGEKVAGFNIAYEPSPTPPFTNISTGVRIYCENPVTCGGGTPGPSPSPAPAPSPPAASTIVPSGSWSAWVGPNAGPGIYDGTCPCGTFITVRLGRGARGAQVLPRCGAARQLGVWRCGAGVSLLLPAHPVRRLPVSAPDPGTCTAAPLQTWNVWADSTFAAPGEAGVLTGLSAQCSGPDQLPLEVGWELGG